MAAPRGRRRIRAVLRSFLAFALLLCACGTPGERGVASAQRAPNLVLFLVDDLGWQDTSVAFSGVSGPFQEHFETPHLAALAAHGLVFSEAHAQCVCTPTRLSILTGQNSARHGTTNWIRDAAQETSGSTAVLGPPPRWCSAGYRDGTPTLPGLLAAHGYRTIHVGKAHFGAVGTPAADPRTLGFDVNIAGHAAGAPGSYQGENGYDRAEETGPSVWAVPGLERFHGTPTHLTDALTIRALEEVEHAVAEGRPFFLELAHYAVHVPLEPHDPYTQHFRALGHDESEARYAAMVAGVDASLGAVLAKLEELGVAEQTLIAFTSDNGGLSAHARGTSAVGGGVDTHNAPLRAGKGSAYEGGTRVPLVFAWARSAPSHPTQRALPVVTGRTDTLSLSEDLCATFLAAAGVSAPAEIDGRDLAPVLAGGAGDPERALLFHYPHVWGPSGAGYEPHSALRRGDWKVLYFYGDERWELYDLAHDLGEQDDRAKKEPVRLAELADELCARLAQLSAPLPLELASGRERAPRLPGR